MTFLSDNSELGAFFLFPSRYKKQPFKLLQILLFFRVILFLLLFVMAGLITVNS